MDSLDIRMKIARQNSGLIQTRLAELVGITKSNISDYERGRANPSIKVLSKIANQCKVDFEWLATGVGEMTPRNTLGATPAFNLDKRLFKESLNAILTIDKKYSLNYSTKDIVDVTISLYKYMLIRKIDSINSMEEKEIIEVVKVFAA